MLENPQHPMEYAFFDFRVLSPESGYSAHLIMAIPWGEWIGPISGSIAFRVVPA